MTWEKVSLGEVCEGIYEGPHATPPESQSGGIFLGIDNITMDGKLELSNPRYIADKDMPKWNKRITPQEGDIIFSNEATLNLYSIIPPNFYGTLGRRIGLLRVDESKINRLFLYFYFFSQEWRALIEGQKIEGTTVERISMKKLPSFEISFPPRDIQDKIANILSDYDDLIELNRRRIAILEEMAMRTYQEWFVHFRFPGHETTEFINGLPAKWEEKKANNYFEIGIGKTPPRKEFHLFTTSGNGIPWLSISDMNGCVFCSSTSEDLTEEAVTKHHIKVIGKNTILLSFKLTVGRVCITSDDICTNEAIAFFDTQNPILREYTYCYLKKFPYSTLGSTSSIATALNSQTVKRMPFVMPCKNILNKFHDLTAPIFDNIKFIQAENFQLQQMRDRLLPQLMSGQLEVTTNEEAL